MEAWTHDSDFFFHNNNIHATVTIAFDLACLFTLAKL